MSDEHPRFAVGDVINRLYEVLECMPDGGMGLVCRVRALADGKERALKHCRYNDPEHAVRFAREVRVMRAIRHPNVLPVLSMCLKCKPPYFTMELAKHSLESELDSLSKDEDAALSAFESICAGVQAIHNNDAIHRDIKPSNALRMLDDRICVADLGVAKFAERDTTILTQTRALVGTDMYAAPEQKMPGGSRNADSRTDVFQLGKTLYQLLTGKSPAFFDLTRLPSGLVHVIKKATRDNPDDRYRSVGELLDAVSIYRMSKDPSAKPADAFESLVKAIEVRAEKGRYQQSELSRLLALLDKLEAEDDELFLDLCHSIPHGLLGVCANDLPDQLDGILRRYVRIINDIAGRRAFSFAETVADKMGEICEASTNADLVTLATQAILIAAVDLNRFAAMSAFDNVLINVKDDGIAMEIAEMLRHQMSRYKPLADRIQPSRLHLALRAVRSEALRK